MNTQITEEILNHFGRTGSKQRPRLRKFHAELFFSKFQREEYVISQNEINRPQEYIHRIVKFSKGFLEFSNEDALEFVITEKFCEALNAWANQYIEIEELDHSDENLETQGIILNEDDISFDGRLSYSRFYKIISDEGESMNDPATWKFNDKNIKSYDSMNFGDKNSDLFGSKLVLLKFYILRKIDEVAFVTSRFVHCPACGANYVIPASKIDFQQTYKCERKIGDKECKTTLKKFPARKMIPTYIYEIAVEVQNKETVEYKEFFLESFVELKPGFFTGMVFGRTEAKTNSFYFTCLTARAEKSKVEFNVEYKKDNDHKFFDWIDCAIKHIQKIGFVIDEDKARLPVLVETLKKMTMTVNREINLDHSLYFGAPGIGKTYALTLLHYMYYSNSGYISGPRFTLAGLTGGQKEIYYQDTAKKKSVPGLFSNQAFLFDEINNAQFLSDDKAINLFKSVALAPSGTSTTVGGKEFPRISLISATANYDVDALRHYENKVKKMFSGEFKETNQLTEQTSILSQMDNKTNMVPDDFDFYLPLKKYGIETPKPLKTAVLRARDDAKNYLTNFPKPLMERFYWSILVHPKYDKLFLKQKKIDVESFLKARKSIYSQRELLSQLFVSDYDSKINTHIATTKKLFESAEVEKMWSKQVQDFLNLLSNKYVEFFSMFHRINQVHVFLLYTLSLINNEINLSFATRRIFERLISLLHNPIEIQDFHHPDFESFQYIGESKGELLELIKNYPNTDITNFVDFDNRAIVRRKLIELENSHKIIKKSEYHYEINQVQQFEKVETVEEK